MNVRKLDRKEHCSTRAMWEEIFTEDDQVFLDYYYSVKAKENEIFVIEEEGKICSMLHLNPYAVRINDRTAVLNYIVAVATKKEYRGKGFMAELLKTAAQEMFLRKEPFTFLMPAAEAIYKPHGFRFVYRQKRFFVSGSEEEKRTSVQIRLAGKEDCKAMAEYAEQYLGTAEKVRDVRTETYYRMLRKEQESENGGILLAEKNGCITGMALYAKEEKKAEIREPFLSDQDTGDALVSWIMGKGCMEISVSGIPKKDYENIRKWMAGYREACVPVIMARIICLQAFLECLKAKRKFEQVIEIRDEMIPRNTGTWKLSSGCEGDVRAEKQNDYAGEAACRIEDLTTVCFGYQDERDVRETEVMRELKRNIETLNPTFLNEIV